MVSGFELNTAVELNQPQPSPYRLVECCFTHTATQATANIWYHGLHTAVEQYDIPTQTHKWPRDDCSTQLFSSVYEHHFLVHLGLRTINTSIRASSGPGFGIKSAYRGMSNLRRLNKKERNCAGVKHTGSHSRNHPGTLIERSISLHQSWCSRCSRNPDRTKTTRRATSALFISACKSKLHDQKPSSPCNGGATAKSDSLTMMTWELVGSAG